MRAILDYVETEWSKQSRNKLQEEITTDIYRISRFPKSCVETRIIKGVRQCVVSKHVSLFYIEQKTRIVILHFANNAQSESELTKNLKRE